MRRTGLIAGLCLCVSGSVLLSCAGSEDPSFGHDRPAVLFALDAQALGSTFPLYHPIPSAYRRQQGMQLPALVNPQNKRAVNEINELAVTIEGGALSGGLMLGFGSTPDRDKWPEPGAATAEDTSGLQLWELDVDGVASGRRIPFRWRYDTLGGGYHAADNLRVIPEYGFTLEPNARHVFVIRKGFGVERSPGQQDLLEGKASAAESLGTTAYTAYETALQDLAELGLARADIAYVQAFATDDPAAGLQRWLQTAIEAGPQPVTVLKETRVQPDFCLLQGLISMPQYQVGKALFYPQGGTWTGGADGSLTETTRMSVPFSITLPRTDMPSGGWPLNIFIHGTAGLHTQIADRGKTMKTGGHPTENLGPGYVFALQGMAGAGAALPVNPDRQPDGLGWGFYNFANIPAFVGNFRQSAVEQAMFLSTLLDLELPATTCLKSDGKPRAAPHRFNDERIAAMGQSLGALVLMLWQNYEPRVGAIIPSGAGAWYTELLATSTTIPGELLLHILTFKNGTETIDPLHPAALWVQSIFESVDPVATAPHILRRPYPGASAKHVYMPAGYVDGFFFPGSINALAGSLGVGFDGNIVEDSLPAMLARVPQPHNVDRTAIVQQFPEDGILDGHHVSYQLDSTKSIYNCFLRSYHDSDTPVVYGQDEIAADGGLSCP